MLDYPFWATDPSDRAHCANRWLVPRLIGISWTLFPLDNKHTILVVWAILAELNKSTSEDLAEAVTDGWVDHGDWSGREFASLLFAICLAGIRSGGIGFRFVSAEFVNLYTGCIRRGSELGWARTDWNSGLLVGLRVGFGLGLPKGKRMRGKDSDTNQYAAQQPKMSAVSRLKASSW
jgi:hypothetical protein